MKRVGEKNLTLPEATQRLDKWLWFARLVKSRTLAASMIVAGKVRVNRNRVKKSSQPIKVGDIVTAMIARRVRVLRVAAPGHRRGPAQEAQLLYEDLSPQGVAQSTVGRYGQTSIADRPMTIVESTVGDQGVRSRGAGRPTKRERRALEKFRSGQN